MGGPHGEAADGSPHRGVHNHGVVDVEQVAVHVLAAVHLFASTLLNRAALAFTNQSKQRTELLHQYSTPRRLLH